MASARSLDDGLDARTLPHNLEAERSLIGAALITNEVLDIVNDVLLAEDFYRDAHRRIWSSLLALHDRRTVADFVTLKEELLRRGELDEVGGPAYIASLADGVPRGVNAPYYAGIVKEKAILRGLIYAANATLMDAYAAEEAASELLVKADKRLLDLQVVRSQDRVRSVGSGINALMARIEQRVANRGQLTGIDTGWKCLNEIAYGWQRRELIIVAARPSVGKTIFTQNTLVSAALAGFKCGMFSLEMKREDLDLRMLAQLSGVDIDRMREGALGSRDYGNIAIGIELMATLPIWIDDRTGHTVSSMRSVCRRKKTEEGLDAVVVDYLQLAKATPELRKATRTEQLGEISRSLKLLADELDIALIAVSQLTRDNEKRGDPRPRLSDLRGSGDLEQDGDTIVFLHRENHRAGGPTEIIFEKQRNGPTGSVVLQLYRELTSFKDEGQPQAEDAPPPPPPQQVLPDTRGPARQRRRRSG